MTEHKIPGGPLTPEVTSHFTLGMCAACTSSLVPPLFENPGSAPVGDDLNGIQICEGMALAVQKFILQ